MTKINENLLENEMNWIRTDDSLFPFRADVKGQTMEIRINDFPEEPLYTLFINGRAVIDFDEWPKNWSR